MRTDPIHEEYPENCAERTYLAEVLERLSRAVGDELDDLKTVALIDLLATRRIEFWDGFVVNDERTLAHTLGYEEASIIGACLAMATAKAPADWKAERLNTSDNAQLRNALSALEHRLRSHSSVVRVS